MNDLDVKRTFLTMLVSILVDGLGLSLLVSVIPYLARDFGANALMVGFLVAGYTLAQMFSASIGGYLSDRYGRKPIILMMLMGSAVGITCQGLSNTYAMLLFFRVLSGLFGGSLPVAQAFCGDVYDPIERQHRIVSCGRQRANAFLFGPVLGALFALIHKRAPFFFRWNFVSYWFFLCRVFFERNKSPWFHV
eukprot:GCRY01002446.1.p1 GENE.GCRY01002446.1~~GCRY01002446.1.p1  ORF type:complete len:192 (+),score=34.47 GCRY01002446.1:179-754(+)